MNISHCPETSKDANGSPGIAGLRLYPMWLSEDSTLHSAKAQPGGCVEICLFYMCRSNPLSLCQGIFYLLFEGGGRYGRRP